MDDPILQGVRSQIARMFGHHLAPGGVSIAKTGDVMVEGGMGGGFTSPGSPNSPPHSIPESLMPLLDLVSDVSDRGSTLPIPSEQQRKLSPHHLMTSPPPDARQRQNTFDEDEKRESNSRTIYVSPSSERPPPAPHDPTPRVLEFAKYPDFDRQENVLAKPVDTTHTTATAAATTATTTATHITNDTSFSRVTSQQPIHHSHQSTAAPATSGALMTGLFSNKLVPSHTRSPTAGAEDPPAFAGQSSVGVPPLFASTVVVTAEVQEKLRHCSAFLGHRSEVERYASLLTMQGIITQHMRALPPNSSVPPGLLQDTTLRAFIVMLEQAPMGIDPKSGGRCHALCLNIIKWYGSQASSIVPRLASLVQRLWTLTSVGGLAENVPSLVHHPWSHVRPRWVVDALVCIGLDGIDVLLDMCQDGYGVVDSAILGMFVGPAVFCLQIVDCFCYFFC